ncbi:MAG TPA: hypothetical protein VI542_01995, partial [Candidatus Tectomicrobia bacterium]
GRRGRTTDAPATKPPLPPVEQRHAQIRLPTATGRQGHPCLSRQLTTGGSAETTRGRGKIV